MNQKEIAIQCLKKLDIYKPYIRKFEKEDMPTFFERFAGFYLFNDPVLQDKVKKVEKEYGVLVYAITHEWFEFGECWSFLCISPGKGVLEWVAISSSRGSSHRTQLSCIAGKFFTN